MKMKDVTHTHPHTNETFGQLFDPTIALTDGGNEQVQTMEDVSHEPPNDGATRAFERGTEGRNESV